MQTIADQLGLNLPSPLTTFAPDWPGADRLHIRLKRDDLIHPVVSGNKWRKLKNALPALVKEPSLPVLSFGGGHSNHLKALGYCCYQLSVPFIAVIRGDYRHSPTPLIDQLSRWGTTIHYLTKSDYRRREEADFLASLASQYPGVRIVPEGGSQQQALAGVADVWAELDGEYDFLLAPVASGGTLAGLIQSPRQPQTHVVGIAVLKGAGYLENLVQRLLPPHSPHQWTIHHQFHQGGYAKSNPALDTFCQQAATDWDLPLEPVYSGKVFFAFKQLMAEDYFPPGSKILVLHTGGIGE